MPKGCTPENVIGAMQGVTIASDHPVSFGDVAGSSPSELNHMQAWVDKAGADQFDSNPGKEGPVAQALGWPGEMVDVAKNVLNDVRNPSAILGEDYIRPVHEFMVDHLTEYGPELMGEDARKAYFKEIKNILSDLQEFPEDSLAFYAAQKYKRFYNEGGEFYNRESATALTKAIHNVAGNVLQNSPTVILGNIAEGAIKLPTLYPETLLPAIQKAFQKTGGKVWMRIPELEAKGVYGSSLMIEHGIFGGRENGHILKDGLIGITDNPLKNIAYYAGELAHGDGLKGVQDVAFVPRFGDLPMVYYSTGSRSLVSFLGYTINSYKMYGQMFKDLSGPNPAKAVQRILTYHTMAALIGGAGAALPQPAIAIIQAAAPDTKDWFDENRSPLAGLIQPGNIDRVGVTADIASRSLKNMGTGTIKGIEALSEQDYAKAVIQGTNAILGAATFSATPVGDAQIQKAIKMGRDAWLDDQEIDLTKFLPWLNQH